MSSPGFHRPIGGSLSPLTFTATGAEQRDGIPNVNRLTFRIRAVMPPARRQLGGTPAAARICSINC
jgi:hypothetical protein